MKHYSTEEWIDFANRTGSGAMRGDMQQHLESGCKRCKKVAALWEKTRQAAAEESRFTPPADMVRQVKSAFGVEGLPQKHRISDILAELLFDSFSQPALVGARSAGSQPRQLLFRTDPYQIDVQIEANAADSRLLVTGQVLDLSRPEIVGSDVPVTITNRRGQTVQTVTNRFGEFRGELDNRGDLELSFPGPGEKRIVVSLADAAGDASRGTARGGKYGPA